MLINSDLKICVSLAINRSIPTTTPSLDRLVGSRGSLGVVEGEIHRQGRADVLPSGGL
jgi:hypothetical protein